jgi:NADPH:quinone reductase-like Zn-dependent oxidoreductase
VLIQVLRNAGVKFIAATSTQTDLLLSLGAHQAIDYTKENYWEIDEFKTDPFDIVFDCAEGDIGYSHSLKSGIIKNSGIAYSLIPRTLDCCNHGRPRLVC